MEKKTRLKRDYERLNTQFIDTTPNSPFFFNVTSIPDILTIGKNVIRIKGTRPNLQENSPVEIEVLDFNKNVIYHEILPDRNDDNTLNVIIHVYPETSPGVGTITFIGTTVVDTNLQPLVTSVLTKSNIKYIHKINVNQKRRNDSRIIYDETPLVEIEEKKYSVLEEKLMQGASFQKVKYASGSASYFFSPSNLRPILKPKLGPLNVFISDYDDAIFKFANLGSNFLPSANFQTQSFSYTATVTRAISPSLLIVSESAYLDGTKNETQLITSFTDVPYEVTYSAESTGRNVTQNIKTYAKVSINKLQPAAGEVSRVKIFYKSALKPQSQYEQIYDEAIVPKNILIDDTSILIENPIGNFLKDSTGITFTRVGQTASFNVINSDTYWEILQENGAPSGSKTLDNNYLFGGIEILPNAAMSGSKELFFAQTSSYKTSFYQDTDYVLKFNYYLYKNSLDPRGSKIAVYMTGSSFINNSSYGAYLGEVSTTQSLKIDHEFPFTSNSDGTGLVKFLLRPGAIISDIRIEELVQKGFGQRRTTLYVPLKSDHKNENLDFKVQFFNYTLQEANEFSEVNSKLFEGGNQYIYGDDNIITGSTVISPFSASGIQLYGNFTGSYSGSAVQGWGYGGKEKAIANKNTASNFGFALTKNNPYGIPNYGDNTVQMINECGSVFDFRTNPASFTIHAVGKNTKFTLGISGSADANFGIGGTSGSCVDGGCTPGGDSYIRFDGCNVIIGNARDANGVLYIAGASGTGGSPTINNAGDGRLLISDGSTNAATASLNLIFTDNKLAVTGSIDISGSILQYGNTITLPSVYTKSIGNNLSSSFFINHNLNSIFVSVHMLNSSASTQIYYPTQQTASLVRGSFHAFISGSNAVTINTPYTASANEFLVVIKT